MSGATKGLSEAIVDKCIENPKLAFLVIPLGLVLMYWGITDAKYYQALGARPTQTISDVAIVSKPNDRGFTIPHVVGKANDKEVSIPISAKTARTLAIGDTMEVVETEDNSGKYMMRSSVDSQNSQVLFNVAGIPVNFITLLGIVIAVCAAGWGALARPGKPAEGQPADAKPTDG